MLKVGLLGAGRIGQVHARAIAAHPGSALAAVSDAVPAAADALAAAHGARVNATEAILDDPGIDAVLIATPTDTHAALIEAAVAAGKAVLCEKPVDLDLARARACLDRVKDSGRAVMVGFNRRFDPGFARLKRDFDAGVIGGGELLALTSFDPAPPPAAYIEVSGGLFRDMAIHDFDLACWIFGALPQTVSATASSLVDPAIGAAGDVDTAVTTLRFADGRLAVIKNSRRAAYGYDQRIEVLGAMGLLSAANLAEDNVTLMNASGVTSARPLHFFLERYARAYAAEWAAFVTAVQDGTPPPVGLADGVAALAVAEAAARSVRTGAAVRLADI